MKRIRLMIAALMLASCAGVQRDCSSTMAQSMGANWVVVQYRFDGRPINCWRLQNVGITNEAHSDGIFWQTGAGHLVHISGWYNRVQVNGGSYGEAAAELGIKLDGCVGGAYVFEEGAPK